MMASGSSLSAGRALGAVALYALYTQARDRLLRHAEESGDRVGPRWLGMATWRLLNKMSELVGVKFASEGGPGLDCLDPAQRYLIVWHPHGFIAWSALFIVSRMAVLGHPHGREWFAMVAPVLFHIPGVSEALILVNGRRVNKSVVDNLANKGRSLALQPGGVHEQLMSDDEQEQAVFPANLGFIRLALTHGMDILPAYIFNENQMFHKVRGFEQASDWLYRATGFGLPIATGRLGVFGWPPKPVNIHVRWGKPIKVGPPDPAPSEERVEELFNTYVAALRTLFDTYAHECLPPEVASKGLKIIRLHGKNVPPDAVRMQAVTPLPVTARSRL